MLSTAPEQLLAVAYVPTGLPAGMPVVAQVGWVVRLAKVSPFTNPLKLGVGVGIGVPYMVVELLAVIVSGAGVIVTLPGT